MCVQVCVCVCVCVCVREREREIVYTQTLIKKRFVCICVHKKQKEGVHLHGCYVCKSSRHRVVAHEFCLTRLLCLFSHAITVKLHTKDRFSFKTTSAWSLGWSQQRGGPWCWVWMVWLTFINAELSLKSLKRYWRGPRSHPHCPQVTEVVDWA